MESIQPIEKFYFNEELIITVIKPSIIDISGRFPLKPAFDNPNMIRFILIMEGELELMIDYTTYRLTRNTLVEIFIPGTLNYLMKSNDLACYELLVSKRFIEEITLDTKPVPITHFTDIRNSPAVELSEHHTQTLQQSIERIIHYLKQKEHNYRKEMLVNTFYNFILELGNIITAIHKNRTEPHKISRKDLVIQDFISLMNEYGKKEHAPSFYAGKLCISTQYLSLILKEKSNKTAGYWLASNLITEAKIMLRTPCVTLQQITDRLNFADQASFGKFFKKHTGISPKKYREEL
ncbi:MAG: helix-turn-helix domain-containing protein [Bacteroidales bacterium]